ncbi:MAG: redoxin domain-containing protein [Planctomycetes bacterium]|nr:redoxin domain-containing protein [Planctomycetota bacterium]
MLQSRVIVGFLAGLMAAVAAAPALAAVVANEGQKPEINWKTIDRKEVNEETLKGRVRLVVFWEDEDQWTSREGAKLKAETDSFTRRGVQVIGYNLDKSSDTARRVTRDQRLGWWVVADGKGWKVPIVADWGVEKLPFAVLMSPDGVVRWRGHPQAMAGSVDRVLKEHPPELTHDQWVALTVRIIQDSTKEIEEDMRKGAVDYRSALQVLSEINPEMLKEPSVLAAAKKMMPLFEPKRDQERLSLEGYMDSYPQAKAALATLKAALTAKPATRPAAETAADQAKKREVLAQQKLDAALEHKKAGRDVPAYKGFKQVADRFAGTPAAALAADSVKEYEANAAFMEQYKKAQQDEEAGELMRLAGNYRSSGKDEEALNTFQKIIDRFPGTEWAKKAKEEMNK